MRVFHGTGPALHWREDGDPDGAPLVFANSLGTDLRLWDRVLPLLPPGLRIIRFDCPGHGLSGTAEDYSMETLIGWVAELLDELGVQGACFTGCSMGGMVGMGLASHRPDRVRALVLSNAAPQMGTAEKWDARMDAIRSGGMERVADAVMAAWFSAAFRADPLFPLWRTMFTRTEPKGYLAACAAIRDADLGAPAAQIRIPTLVIGGSEDGASPPAQLRATADMIPTARYHEIGGAGHLPAVETPHAFATELTAFLKETAHV